MAFTNQLFIVSLLWTCLLSDKQTNYEDEGSGSASGGETGSGIHGYISDFSYLRTRQMASFGIRSKYFPPAVHIGIRARYFPPVRHVQDRRYFPESSWQNYPGPVPIPISPLEDKSLSPEDVEISDLAMELLSGTTMRVVLPTLFLLIFIVGCLSNLVALVILIKMRKNPTVIFMINLATSDLLFALQLPLMIAYRFLQNNWIFGHFLCYAFALSFFVNMHVSILLLAVISADRYLGVLHPFSARLWRTNRYAVTLCVLAWVIVLVFNAPVLATNQVVKVRRMNVTTCMDVLRNADETQQFYHSLVTVIALFLLPLCVIIFSHCSIIRHLTNPGSLEKGARKRQAVVTGIVVTAIFIVCYLPANVSLLIRLSFSRFLMEDTTYFSYFICLSLSSVNCCLNPFVYYFACSPFRTRLKRLLPRS